MKTVKRETQQPDFEIQNKAKKVSDERYIKLVLLQIFICVVIIFSIIFVKFISPDSYTYLSAKIQDINSENITLADLGRLLDENVRENDALAVFFNADGVKAD
ncbi:MAG: hypothetical protein AB9835_04445 [Eubacteriales bacterium]